eukprot:5490024-Prymnesium_polylepis.1
MPYVLIGRCSRFGGGGIGVLGSGGVAGGRISGLRLSDGIQDEAVDQVVENGRAHAGRGRRHVVGAHLRAVV